MRRIAIISCVAGLLLLGASGTAGAATFTPTGADFGSQPVGTTSAPKTITLGLGTEPAFAPGIGISGQFRQTNTCPALLLPLLTPTCTVSVTFTPASAGRQTGQLTSAAVLVGAPSASLTGTGTEAVATPAKKCKKKKKKKKGGKKGKRSATAAKKKGRKQGKCKKKKKGGKKK
jgi:hypothetical protein